MSPRAKAALVGLALLSLAACGTSVWPRRPTSAEQRAQYMEFAGPPIDSFTYLARYYAWTPLGHLQLVLWTDINDAYLITVLPPCVGLDFTYGITVTNAGHLVTRGVDAILFNHQTCFISQIRPIDYLAMKRKLHTLP